jgi:hypothetical protein
LQFLVWRLAQSRQRLLDGGESSTRAGVLPLGVNSCTRRRAKEGTIISSAIDSASTPMPLKYNLLAERQTRALPRVFVEYPNLLDSWHREKKRISAALAIDLNPWDEGAIEEFLKQDLRRQRHCGPVTELFGADWNSAVYETLRAAARDEPWEVSALDRVFEAYRASEHGFRTASEDFRHNFNNVLLRPSILKLIGEVLAIAHRRRGTWA